MTAPNQRFTLGDTVWFITPYGAVTSGPVTEVSGSVHYAAHDGIEIIAHPAFATQAEAGVRTLTRSLHESQQGRSRTHDINLYNAEGPA